MHKAIWSLGHDCSEIQYNSRQEVPCLYEYTSVGVSYNQVTCVMAYWVKTNSSTTVHHNITTSRI